MALVGHIPYDTVVTEAMVQGLPATVHTDGPVAEALRRMWEQVKDRLWTWGIRRMLASGGPCPSPALWGGVN